MFPISRARFSRAPGTSLIDPPYLEWVSATGDSIAFDGVKYAMLRSGAFEGFSGSTGEIVAETTVTALGEIYCGLKFSRRIISFRAVAIGKNRADLEGLREEVIRALNPYSGEGRIIWRREDGTSRYLNCSISSGYPRFADGTKRSARLWYFDVEFIAPDPCWYAADEIVIENPDTNHPYGNPGDMPCAFRMGFAGHSRIVMRQSAPNREFEVVLMGNPSPQDLVGVVLDTTPGNITLTKNDVNLMHMLSFDSDLFMIASGNFVFPLATGMPAYIAYRPRWMGV